MGGCGEEFFAEQVLLVLVLVLLVLVVLVVLLVVLEVVLLMLLPLLQGVVCDGRDGCGLFLCNVCFGQSVVKNECEQNIRIPPAAADS